MSLSSKRSAPAVLAAAVLLWWGGSAVALADPGNGNGTSEHPHHDKVTPPGQAKPSGSSATGHGTNSAPGQATAPGQGDGSPVRGAEPADPPGNNGTIKITPLGEQDGTPDNNPHPTCGFQIEWYGFDEGDYYSQVSFAMQAPTKDATITPNGPTSVFVGGDPASGAGTATGLDAREAYYPTFTGTPHPKQGFHVKVTVATPFSQGNDTKSKVFWVQPCDTETPETPETPDTPGTPETPETPDDSTVSPPTSTNGGTGSTVVPAQAFGTAVPTAVDAGQSGSSILDRVRSPLPLVLMAGALAAIALWSLRRVRGEG